MKKLKLIYASIMCLFAISCISCKQTKDTDYLINSGEIWATTYHITYQSDTAYTKEFQDEFQRFSKSLNPFDSLSLVTHINQNTGFETDSLFRKCFNQAIQVSELSNGAYDVTCSPLVNAWGFGFKHKENINQQKVDSILKFVGYKKVRIVGNKLIKDDPRIMLDFSSIAKGYSADCIAEVLNKKKVNNYLVEIGGEIAFKGLSPQGQEWRVGIDKPSSDNKDGDNDLQLIISLPKEAGGLATSGNYRNFYIKDGKRYAHTIDPTTGYPVQRDVLSATVVAKSSMIADAFSTTFMVVGKDKAEEIARKAGNIEYMLICSGDNQQTYVVMSPGFEKMVVQEEAQ